ncbi:hypothetical protein EV363DRAFT_1258504 [Boletus edulis]|nr:hypothetical protein EV363DRAFT_1258504 [Boletus edulis]
MHHALQIQEILSNIFDFCSPPLPSAYYKKATSSPELVALAGTCRAFKEPALNALWRVLVDLSPLARCLPEASHRLVLQNMYSFTRPLTKTEWDVIQSYARRVRSILDIHRGLNKESLRTLSDHFSATGPLFPNLRTLHGLYARKTIPLLHLPLPSLVSLDIKFENLRLFQESFKSFPNHFRNIRRLVVRVQPLGLIPLCIKPGYFCRWQNLWSLDCPQLALDRDALLHLSRMPALTQLGFALSAALPAFDTPPLFSNLHRLKLYSESLQPTSRLLSQIQLPTITDLIAFVDDYPSREELSSFLAGIRTSSAGNTIQKLQLAQSFPCLERVPRSDALLLGFEDLRPCMGFRNLRHLSFDIEWNVGLTDSDVLTLATAWPRLEVLLINEEWGWNSQGGITPGGLVRLLQTCQSLLGLALALDTRGYTEPPSSEVLASFQSTLPPVFSVDVVDSSIKAESMPAVTTLFSGFAACSNFSFVPWRGGW